MQQSIADHVNKLQNNCLKAYIIEYQYFLYKTSNLITTSGDVKKFSERLNLESMSRNVNMRSLRDSFFIVLLKLLESSSRNKLVSVPNLIDKIKK
ncbi:hypothetical protein [Francisella orientalis]|uniref:Uncharacterized protein n=2 Tax=Francisella orientalis TaxID=299583 RepID=A0AAP7KJN7_9GAMM|nr:hypothetical protein [Francisella orientalis]AFJ42706.1 hypothetical protein OOM_0147 [Francisella orientalis str. Toba 04]AHB99057.1 hypothetical protein M973_01140 [Francisella orientalis LADL 07-285A]AKN84948.1 hypothetical protein FNO12_0146 [Francisella orientalis FNO12]AKN86486.1 Hypothetical protein FNO24_0146 [Francisella orientalis FNO24]AKN88024.1 Hypothetical protein FNO190_0146 [Francisella orientalis]